MYSMFYKESSFNADISDWNVNNVTDMYRMFKDATSFNQNLSSWCVTNITEKPLNFDTDSALTSENLPVWGTCPQ